MPAGPLAQALHYRRWISFFVILIPGALPDLESISLTHSFALVVDFATLPLCGLGAEKHENTANVHHGGLKNRGKKNLQPSQHSYSQIYD